MGLEKLLKKLKRQWHKLFYLINRRLYEDCLDEKEKAKIKSKMEYHKLKMFPD
jgi:hypothetical protein